MTSTPPPAPAASRRPRRRLLALVGILVVLLVGSGVAVAQVRAAEDRALRAEQARAAEAREAAADAAAEAEARRLEEEREAERRRAEQEAAAELEAEREAVRTAAATELPPAEELLGASVGQVGDDHVRLALAQAIDAVRAALEGDVDPAAARGALGTLTAAREQVVAAQQAWTAEQEAAAARAAAEEEQARARAASGAGGGGASSGGGAAADCGGPGSREASSGGGPTFYTSTPAEQGDGSNGRIPRSQMTALGWCVDSRGNAQWLRSDAAAALVRLNEAFRAHFGENIAVDMSYRSYEDQVAMREHYGSVAAQPGTSNHGWGTAFDVWEWQAYGFGSERYAWLVANGPSYGWVAPAWARQGGSNPEYWHFEYTG